MVLAQNDPAQRGTAGTRDESEPHPLVTLGVGLLLVVLCIVTTMRRRCCSSVRCPTRSPEGRGHADAEYNFHGSGATRRDFRVGGPLMWNLYSYKAP